MDNNINTNTQPTVPHSPYMKYLLIVLAVLLLFAAAVFGFKYFGSESQPAVSSAPTATPQLPSPTPVRVYVDTAKGTITAIDSQNLTLKTEEAIKTYSLSKLRFVLKVTSGTLEAGNAQITSAKADDIKIGQEVTITLTKGTTDVIDIFITKDNQ